MIDQMERAVQMETKRSMYRALTHLRGVTIGAYDGMANAQSTNIDEYARSQAWTKNNNVQHLPEREAPVSGWAFPNGATGNGKAPAPAAPAHVLTSGAPEAPET